MERDTTTAPSATMAPAYTSAYDALAEKAASAEHRAQAEKAESDRLRAELRSALAEAALARPPTDETRRPAGWRLSAARGRRRWLQRGCRHEGCCGQGADRGGARS